MVVLSEVFGVPVKSGNQVQKMYFSLIAEDVEDESAGIFSHSSCDGFPKRKRNETDR